MVLKLLFFTKKMITESFIDAVIEANKIEQLGRVSIIDNYGRFIQSKKDFDKMIEEAGGKTVKFESVTTQSQEDYKKGLVRNHSSR